MPSPKPRCPHCNERLDESWLRRWGAALMGRKGGKAKARASEKMRAAANKRWNKEK